MAKAGFNYNFHSLQIKLRINTEISINVYLSPPSFSSAFVGICMICPRIILKVKVSQRR